MSIVDVLYVVALSSVMLVSSAVLLWQFLRGDLTEQRRTSRMKRTTYALLVSRRRERAHRRETTPDVARKALRHAPHLSPR